MVAMQGHARHLRDSEFRDRTRSRFCLMSACQDCWIDIDQAHLALPTTLPGHQPRIAPTHPPFRAGRVSSRGQCKYAFFADRTKILSESGRWVRIWLLDASARVHV